MYSKNVVIVGVGNIGSCIYSEFKRLSPDRYDPYKGFTEKKDIHYDLAVICVDTPMNPDGSCNLEQVIAALNETDAELYMIKSTVSVGATEMLKKETRKRIVFSPEYFGPSHHSSNFDYPFTILGGSKEDTNAVQQILQDVYDARHTFYHTEPKIAELSKYMENSYLAMKVSFCIQFWEICQKLGLSYPELREAFLLDTRINPANSFVYDEHPFWESHCFDKDLPALAAAVEAPFIEAIIEYNEGCKRRYKSWQDQK